MALKKGDFIKLSYTGRMEDGKVFDTTDEAVAKAENVYTPQGLYGGDVVVIGCGHTIAGLDKELEGKNAGDEGKVTIGPEEAFGMPREDLIQSVSTSKFKDGRAQVGMVIEQDGRQGVVTKVLGRRATIDFNSPLAGKNVVYDFKIEAVLETDDDKIKGLFAL
ncbi:MAG: peptidylprolyl isomerase, partial [Methanimicrococcus sp.]|nr:peptidylprolyl isomerase [Methanimicrococcus sp.]